MIEDELNKLWDKCERKFMYKSFSNNSDNEAKYLYFKNKNKKIREIKKIVDRFAKGTATKYCKFGVVDREGRKVYYTKDGYTELLTMYIQYKLKKIFKISTQNRKIIIKNILIMMEDYRDFSVMKIDIKNYFNSIKKSNVNSIINDVCYEKSFRVAMTSVLKKMAINDTEQLEQVQGVGAGLAFSNILAEIIGEKIDYRITKGIKDAGLKIKYFRYVDDILLLGHFDSSEEQVIKDIVCRAIGEYNLEFNDNKYIFKPRFCTNVDQIDHFTYLGYLFKVKKHNNNISVVLGIAENKIETFQAKIEFAVDEYKSTGDYHLLNERLDYYSSTNIVRFSKNNYRCFGFSEAYVEYFRRVYMDDYSCIKFDEDTLSKIEGIYEDNIKNNRIFDKTLYNEKYKSDKVENNLSFSKRRIFINNPNYINKKKLKRKLDKLGVNYSSENYKSLIKLYIEKIKAPN